MQALTSQHWPGIGNVVWRGGRVFSSPLAPAAQPTKPVFRLVVGATYRMANGSVRTVHRADPEIDIVEFSFEYATKKGIRRNHRGSYTTFVRNIEQDVRT